MTDELDSALLHMVDAVRSERGVHVHPSEAGRRICLDHLLDVAMHQTRFA